MSTARRTPAPGAPVVGETVTLFQALALIALDDATFDLDLPLPARIAAIVSPTTGQAVSGHENEVTREMAAWIDARAVRRSRLAIAADRLSSFIGDGTVPAKGERKMGGVDQSNATEFHNPIPVHVTELQNSVCEIHFDQGKGVSDGGQVLFRKGTLDSGAPHWVRYCDVHLLRAAVEQVPRVSDPKPKLTEEEATKFLVQYVETQNQQGVRPTRGDIQAAASLYFGRRVPEPMFRVCIKRIPSERRFSAGRPPKPTSKKAAGNPDK